MSIKTYEFGGDNSDFGRVAKYEPSPQITQQLGPDRVSFIYWPGLESGDPTIASMTGKNPVFLGGKRIYIKGAGYVCPKFSSDKNLARKEESELLHMYAQDNPDKDASKALGVRGITLVVVWARTGTDKPHQVLPWLMTPQLVQDIQGKNQRFPLYKHDLLVSAQTKGQWSETKVESDGQSVLHMGMTSAEGGDLKAKAAMAALFAKARELIDALPGLIGTELTMDELRVRRGGGPASHSSSAPNTAAAPMAQDVSALVQNLLNND